MSIEINNISKLFGKQKALDQVSFSVKKGELVGFLGPNGAGKSTMMKIITGFLTSDSGTVLINGRPISSNNTAIRKDIGYLPENNPLYTDLYIKEYLEITAGFYKLKNKKQRVAEMIGLTGLGDEQHKKIGSLSKGYRQRVGLAQALIHDPSVLILDEATTGLDPNQLEEIRQLIRNISQNKTVLISTHIMQEVEAMCNRVIIINKGKIIADGDMSEMKSGKLQDRQVVLVEFSNPVNPKLLQKIDGVINVKPDRNFCEVEANAENDIRPQLFQFAVENDLTLLTMQEKKQNLENIFRQITRE